MSDYKEYLQDKESYIIDAINERFGNYVSDVHFVDLDREDFMPLFEGYNTVADMPCLLKTDGRTLWYKLDDEHWVEAGEYNLNDFLPTTENDIFIDHFKAIEVINEFDFSKDDLVDLLGVLYSQRKLTEEELKTELESAKNLFALANE